MLGARVCNIPAIGLGHDLDKDYLDRKSPIIN